MTRHRIRFAAILAGLCSSGCIVTYDTIDLCDNDEYKDTPHCMGAQCLPSSPPPFFLWIGPTADAPASCDDDAPIQLFEAYRDLVPGTFSCPACSCGASETECNAPIDWTVIARACSDPPGSSELYFGGPPGWNGACTNDQTIAADMQCPGGEPCAQSIVVAAPEVIGAPCAPQSSGEPTIADPAWSWSTLARACLATTPSPSDFECDTGKALIDRPPPGYRICVERPGTACPTGFPEQHDLYKTAEDTRACSPCTCGAPERNACTFALTAHSNDTCGSTVGTTLLSTTEPSVCFDVPDGTALASKQAKLLTAAPGTCPPTGGTRTGEVVPHDPVAFCCQPLPE